MLVALAAASFLLFATWDRLRVPYYRRPLLFTALGLAAVIGPAAFATWRPDAHITLALALTGLTLAAVAGELPARVLVHGSLIAFLGVWLKGLDATGLTMPTGTLFFGLAVVTYGLIVLGVAEWLAARLSRGLAIRGRRHELFSSQIAPFAIVASFVGDAMAWIDLGISWWPGLILLLAGTSLLWATRFVREPVLVYLGLWNLAGGMMEMARREFAGATSGSSSGGWRSRLC